MRKIFFSCFILLSIPLFSISIPDGASLWDTMVSNPADSDPWELANYMTAELNDEQALAQIFMFGWVGVEPSPLIMNWIRERNIG